MAPKPNIVWIMPDEWRHDALGYAGNPVVQTPNLDAVAASGAVFRNAHCESPVCQPSRASLLTASYCSDHGLFDNEHIRSDFPRGQFPAPDVDTFAKRLQSAGYHTAQIGKMHLRHKPGRLNLAEETDWIRSYGFDHVEEESDKWVMGRVETPYTRYLKQKGLYEGWIADTMKGAAWVFSPEGGPLGAPENLHPDDTLDGYIGRKAAEFVQGYSREEPFFLWIGFVGPHMPYDGPPEFSDRYEPSAIPLGPLGLDPIPDNRWGDWLRFNVKHLRCERLTESDCRTAAKYYYGTITLIDEQVGRILAAIERAGIAGETWVFFGSDHGELMGDHGLMSKRFFYRSSVLVPGIIRPPGGASSPVVVRGPTQNIDMVGSMLELAGATLQGTRARSLLGALHGADVARPAVFSEIGGFLMVATERHELVVWTETLEPQVLYDLQADPDERNDLLADPSSKPIVDELMERFVRPFAAGERG